MHQRLLATLAAVTAASTATAAAPTYEQLWDMLQQQQREIRALTNEVRGLKEQSQTAADEAAEAKQQASENAEAVAATAEAVESSATSKLAQWAERTTIGGYGELHYNNLDGDGGASDKDQVDFHRFVLFFGHEFTDRLRFFSELEVEHALSGDDKPGEVELEQAYLDYDLNDNHTARAGVFLLPVGILNETHEPDTFYGVERNPVEARIIPTTWWEAGAGLHGNFGAGWSYDLYAHSGLAVGSDYGIRGGRQKVAEAAATDPAFTARVKYTGIPGLEVAASAQYQADITQDLANGAPETADATLLEAHIVYQNGPFAMRALVARWDIDADAAEAIGRDEQWGFYVEPSFRVTDNVGLFARYSQYDNSAGDSSLDGEKRQVDLGVNWWLHENVVLKADYQHQDNENGADQSGINLGLGYQFY